jgi:hypothetical protein
LTDANLSLLKNKNLYFDFVSVYVALASDNGLPLPPEAVVFFHSDITFNRDLTSKAPLFFRLVRGERKTCFFFPTLLRNRANNFDCAGATGAKAVTIDGFSAAIIEVNFVSQEDFAEIIPLITSNRLISVGNGWHSQLLGDFQWTLS